MLGYQQEWINAVPTSVGRRLRAVLSALDDAGVAHAYWKASRRLTAVLDGDGDYDLLVRPGERSRWQPLLEEAGFVPTLPRPALRVDGLWHYIAAAGDGEPGVAWLHVHEAPLSGIPGVWGYQLGTAADLLAHRERDAATGVVRLSRELEATVLLLRAFTEPKLRFRGGELIDRARADLEHAWLLSEPAALEVALRAFGSEALADHLLELHSTGRSPADPLELHRLRGLFAEVLPRYRRLSRGRIALGRSLERLAYLWRRARGRRPRGHRLERGVFVAVVGPDGAGKSTLVEDLRRWLVPPLEVHTTYLGKGSVVADAWQGAAALKWRLIKARTGRDQPRPGPGQKSSIDEPRPSSRQRLFEVDRVAQAFRQMRRARRARKQADAGHLVFADRFPHHQERYGAGPAIQIEDHSSRWTRALAALERRLLDHTVSRYGPDVILRLAIPAESAWHRKPEHNVAEIRRKVEALDRLSYPGATMIVLDASRPPEEVARKARHLLWSLYP